MRPAEACNVLNDFLYSGLSVNIFERVSTHRIIAGNGTVAIMPSKRLGIVGDGSVSIQEYLSILREDRISAVYADGSIIYVECIFRGERLFEHRYIFLPTPFSEACILDRPAGSRLEEWLTTCLDEYGVDCIRSVGMIRFDCVRQSLPNPEDPHPITHLTFASNNCRIPVQGPVQIRSFIDFVFDHYYRSIRFHWLDFASQIRLRSDEITIRNEEMFLHHLEWELKD